MSRVVKKTHDSALQANAPYRSALKAPDPFIIKNKHPDREYRFLSRELLQKSGGFDRRGWEVLTADKNQGERLGSEWGTVSDSTDLIYGDLVVGFMPKERAEQRRAVLTQTQSLAQSSIYRVKQTARAEGVLESSDSKITIQRPGQSIAEEY